MHSAPFGHTSITIRDAPRHIHIHLAAQGIPEHWIDEFLFKGDPFIKQEDVAKNAGLGRLSSIVHLENDSFGVLRGVRDIVLDRALAERNRVTSELAPGTRERWLVMLNSKPKCTEGRFL